MDTSAMDIPNSRAIAKQLLVLSQDPDNQPFICQEEGCLAGLAGYLDHWELEIVLMSSRALQFLSSNPANKERIRNFPGIVDKLDRLLGDENAHARVKEFSKATLENLGFLGVAESTQLDEDQENCNKNIANIQQPASEQSLSKKGKRSGVTAPYQSVTLQVENLGNSLIASQVKKALFKVPGVISVVVSVDLGRITVGLRWSEKSESPTKALLDAISTTGTTGTSWSQRSTAASKETRIPFSSVTNKPDFEDDGYLDEEEEDGEVETGDNAVTRFGDNSLSARLERQRLEEERNTRLISKVSSAFSNAGSWLLGW